MKFKVGDRVRLIHDDNIMPEYQGVEVTISSIGRDGTYYGKNETGFSLEDSGEYLELVPKKDEK